MQWQKTRMSKKRMSLAVLNSHQYKYVKHYDVRSPLFEEPLHDNERPVLSQPLYRNISPHSLLPLSRAYHNAVRPCPSSNVTSAKY